VTGRRGSLAVVSTPIGNLADLSLRAVDVLRSVDVILAEDTRHSAVLLAHYGVATRVEAYHEHNEAASAPRIVRRLTEGARMALISDAGTPLLSDPGARLVRAAIDAGIPVVPIPGASALLAALVGAGLPLDRFTFLGFLERKGRARTEAVQAVVASRWTCVLYEAPGRVAGLLSALRDAGAGDRPAVVARELTKQFEEFQRGTVTDLARRFADAPPRGEVVVVIGAAVSPEPDAASIARRARELRAAGMSARDVTRVLCEEMGAPRNLAYRLAHE